MFNNLKNFVCKNSLVIYGSVIAIILVVSLMFALTPQTVSLKTIDPKLLSVVEQCVGKPIWSDSDVVPAIAQCDLGIRKLADERYPNCMVDVEPGDMFLAVATVYNADAKSSFTESVNDTITLVCSDSSNQE